MATNKYKCKVCGYIHEGATAPEKCPVCQAPASEFELIEGGEQKKKGINKNSNAYIMVYTTIIVVIVALLLSITSGALKSRQNANIELDKKKQILSSLPAVVLEGADAAQLFADNIKHIYILDETGEIIKDLDPVSDFNYAPQAGEYVIYMAEVEQTTKWIIPLYGKGLWGAIWGYIALDDDRNTINGVYFSHASETPGLGANIVMPAFRKPFIGKHIMQNGKFASIAIMKAGQSAEGQDQVDAISGGTITSKGVESMLQTSIAPYEPFLVKSVAQEAENATIEATEELVITEE
ncbi:MAG: NADH:ubiquinone reductase (Na(+)-transporting) subunit C [Paludibacteraceae bacterium]|nr:NADH:ubiquinone reductase (Na(+)-transporting) subunit C [Paludibacteraceae bacterium]MBO7258664.1 NADH:ubiquinone reductase (Na(+)-transporting) subunit C [Paludibacteraceae bacterium]